MKKSLFLSLVVSMALVVVSSNILVQFLLGNWLTWAAFTYPIAFLVTDIANRMLGPSNARKIVLYGLITGIFCSFIASQLTNSDGIPYTTFRIAFGSGLAFFAAQMIDVFIFTKLRNFTWWKAPAVSTVIASIVDTTVFFSVAFSTAFIFLESANDVAWANELLPILGFGLVAPLWVSLAIADFTVKMLVASVALLPFRYITRTKEF